MRILIADSNVLFTRLVRLKLEKWGHTVDTALTGLEAWDMARQMNYRVVILDWPLEGIDGGQLCQQIRNLDRSRYTYILFYSDKSDNESVMKAFEAGTDDYLFKPFNPLLLRLRLKTGKRLLNLEDELLSVRSFDPQTGLINYEVFARFFRTHLAGAVRYAGSGTLMAVRLENYGDVYQTHGYEAATKLMIEISQTLAEHLRAADLIARVTDDTYFVLLPQTSAADANTVVTKLKSDIAQIFVLASMAEVRANVEINYAEYPQEAREPDELLSSLLPAETPPVSDSVN